MTLQSSLRCIVYLGVIGLATACGGARRSRPGAVVPIGAFSVTSLRSAYGIQGTLNGSVVKRDEWITVTIDSGVIRTQQADPAPVWGLRLRAGLATCGADGGSQIASESRAIRVAPLVGISSRDSILDASLRPLRTTARLDVAIPPETRVDRAWLVIQLEWPFENEFATYSLDVDVPLDGSASGGAARVSAARTPLSMRTRCTAPG